MNILIVDDDPNSREVLTDILTFSGMIVETVPTGEDAIVRINQTLYDGILVDLKLPGMDGWEFLSAIKPNIATPCIAITVYDNPMMYTEITKAGFDGYFAKPVDEMTFAQSLLEILS